MRCTRSRRAAGASQARPSRVLVLWELEVTRGGGSGARRRIGPPRSNSQNNSPNVITLVLQIVAPLSSSSPPLFSCALSGDAIRATSASTFAAVITPSRASATVLPPAHLLKTMPRRRPRERQQQPGLGDGRINQTQPGSPISFQPPSRLASASATCSPITSRRTANVASYRDFDLLFVRGPPCSPHDCQRSRIPGPWPSGPREWRRAEHL